MRLAGALLALALLAGPRPAAAHATLLGSQPADGAILETAPEAIELSFDEPVAIVAVSLLGPQGRAVPVQARVANRTLRFDLPPALGPGSYIASYRVVSLDSHAIGGAIGFAIGHATAAPAGAGFEQPSEWPTIVRRALYWLALLSAVGLAMARAALLPADRGFTPRILAAAAIGIPLAGLSVGAGALALLIAATLAGLPRTAGVAALGAAASLALSGHAAALSPAWLYQPALAVHAIAAAFWLGSLIVLPRALRTLEPMQAAALVRRFSRIAMAAVAALLAAGIVLALALAGSDPQAALASGYGRLLLLKIGLVVPLLALALYNKVAATNEQLRRNAMIELALIGGIVALTAVLGHTPPVRAGFSATLDSVELAVRPARAGANRVLIAMRATSVALEFALPQAGLEPLRRAAAPLPDGRFEALVDLPLPGTWRVRIEALVGDFEKRVVEADVPVR